MTKQTVGSPSTCDHTSVGVLVWIDCRLLLIERVKPPFGFAPPSGHVDDHGSFEEAAMAELREEVDLVASRINLIAEGRISNKCRRIGGNWHYWRIYNAKVRGTPLPNLTEAKSLGLFSSEEIGEMARRTVQKGSGLKLDPAWVYWFSKIGIIEMSKTDLGELDFVS